MRSKGKLLGSIIGIILFIICISGITYAIYTWKTMYDENVDIEATSKCFMVNYTKGSDIGSNEEMKLLEPVDSYTKGLSSTVKVSMDTSCTSNGSGTIYLVTNDNTNDSLIEEAVLYYQVLDGTTEVRSGPINTKEPIPIYEKFSVTNATKSITVYVWLNGEYVTNDNFEILNNAIYDGKITARVEGR